MRKITSLEAAMSQSYTSNVACILPYSHVHCLSQNVPYRHIDPGCYDKFFKGTGRLK